MGRWRVDGVELGTYANNVRNRSASWSTPETVGDNDDIPGMNGTVWVPGKKFGEGSLNLEMWVAGCTPDGRVPTDQTSGWYCRENYSKLTALFGKKYRLLDVQRIESSGFGQINRLLNPGMEGKQSGPTLYRNSVTNPLLNKKSLLPVWRNLFPNPNWASVSGFSTFAENLAKDPKSQRYRSNPQEFLTTNIWSPPNYESGTVGSATASYTVATNVTALIRSNPQAWGGGKVSEVKATAALAANAGLGKRVAMTLTDVTKPLYARHQMGRVQSATTTRTVQARLNFQDASSTALGSTSWQSVTLPTAQASSTNGVFVWTETPPAGTTKAEMEFRTGEAWSTGDGFYLNNSIVSSQSGSTATPVFWDGTNLWSYWVGTTDLSTSRWSIIRDSSWVPGVLNAYWAVAHIPTGNVTGQIVSFTAMGDATGPTQTFTQELDLPTPGEQYCLRFVARSRAACTVELCSIDGSNIYTPIGSAVTVNTGAVTVAPSVAGGSGTSQDMTGTLTEFAGVQVTAASGDKFGLRVTVPVQTDGSPIMQFSLIGATSWLGISDGDVASGTNTAYAWSGTPYQSKTIVQKRLITSAVNRAAFVGAGGNFVTSDVAEIMCRLTGNETRMQLADIPIDQIPLDNGCSFALQVAQRVWNAAAGTDPLSAHALIEAIDAGNNVLQTTQGADVALAKVNDTQMAAFQTVGVTAYTLPAGTVAIRCSVRMVSPQYGQIMYSYQPMVCDRAAPMPFIQGASFSDGPRQQSAWLGTADASATVMNGLSSTGWFARKGIINLFSSSDYCVRASATGNDAVELETPVTIDTTSGLASVAVEISTVQTELNAAVDVYAVLTTAPATDAGPATVVGSAFLGRVDTAIQQLQGVVPFTGVVGALRIRCVPTNGNPARYGNGPTVSLWSAFVSSNDNTGFPRQDGNQLVNASTPYRGWFGDVALTDTSLNSGSNVLGSFLNVTTGTAANGSRVPITAGQQLYVKARGRCPTANWHLRIRWFNGTTLLSTSVVDDCVSLALEDAEAFVTAPTSTTQAQYEVYTDGAATMELYRAYAVVVQANRDYGGGYDPFLYYFAAGRDTSLVNKNRNGTDPFGYPVGWEGTVGASKSVVASLIPTHWPNAADQINKVNLASNPSSTTASTNWTGFAPGTSVAISRQTSGGPSGFSTFTRGTLAGASSSVGGGLSYSSAGGDTNMATAAGDYRSVSAWLRCSKAQQVAFLVEYINAAGTVVGNGTSTVRSLAANTWLSATFANTVAGPAGTVRARVSVIAVSGGTVWASGDTLDVAGLTVEPSAVPGGPFDGNSAASGTNSYRWLGTAGASISQQYTPAAQATLPLRVVPPPGTPPPGSSGLVAAFPRGTQGSTRVARSEITARTGTSSYLSGEVSVARPALTARITAKLLGFTSISGAGETVLWSATSTQLAETLRFLDVLTSLPYFALQIEYQETGLAGPGIGATFDNAMVIYNSTPLASDYPGYFDGNGSGANWSAGSNDSESTNYAGGRRCWAEQRGRIEPKSMAGGTRAEFEIALAVPAAFWEDIGSTTIIATTTATDTTIPLSDFAGSTAPIDDAVITLEILSGAGPTALQLFDVVSGDSISIAFTLSTSGSTKLVIDCGNLTVTSYTPAGVATNRIRLTTKAGTSRFLSLNSDYPSPPSLRVLGSTGYTGQLQVTVVGKRKYLIG